MASKKDRQRILTGGLDLLPPADKLSDGESLLMDNWRSDQLGVLRSRQGLIIEAASMAGGIIHTIARAGANRYVGVGGNLYQGTSNLLASGFDGNPLGIAFYQGAAWVMNRNKRLRIKGNQVANWGVPAPSTAPVATAGAQQIVTIEEWDGSASAASLNPGTSAGYLARTGGISQYVENPFLGTGGIFDNKVVLTPCVSYDNLNKVSGNASLKIQATVAAPWLVTNNFRQEIGGTIDTRAPLAGAAQDDDFFRLWVWCNDPTAVESIVITLISGPTTNFPTNPNPVDTRPSPETGGVPGHPDFFRTPPKPFGAAPGDVGIDFSTQKATATIPGGALGKIPSPASGVWTRLQIRRNVNVDGLQNTISDLAANPASPTQALADAKANLASKISTPHFTAQVKGDFQTALRQDNAGNFTVSNETTVIDWTAISGMQIMFNLKAPCILNVDQAHFLANISGSLDGSGAYFVSFANADNQDGNLSPESNTLTVKNQAVTLGNIPTSSDPQVTQRWIWRVGFGSSQTLKVGTIRDNSSTTFIDVMTVDRAQNIGVTAPVNRDLPPPASGVVGPYFGKLIAYSSADHPARYWWSPSAQPWFFPGALDPSVGNWEDAGSDDDPIIKITNHTNLLLIYKQRSLWRLIGDPVNNDPELVDDSVGLVGPNAVAKAGALGDYFMANEGLYLRNQDDKRKISSQLDPIFKSDYVQLSNGEFLPPLYTARNYLSAMEIVNDRLYISYAEQGHSLPNVVLMCLLPGAVPFGSLPSYRWCRMYMSTALGGGFTVLRNEGGPYFLMGGSSSSALCHLEVPGSTFDGTSSNPINVRWQSRFTDQGLPDNYKRYADLEVEFQTAFGNESPASTLTVYIVYDNGTKIGIGLLSSLTRTTNVFSLRDIQATGQDLRAKNVSVRIEGNPTTTCFIFSVYLHWYPEERVALTFDSGFTDLGIQERVKEVDYVELYATGTGQNLTRMLSSDLPGSLLTQRLNDQVVLPNGRGDVRTRLGTSIDGRNFRLMLSAPTLFQIHAARIRQRVIGEYIDGTISGQEYFESAEFSVEPGRVGELKDFLLDYDVSGVGGVFQIYSDLPGTGFVLRRSLPIPFQNGRAPYIFPLEDVNDLLPFGQLFKVRLLPPGGGVLRLHGRAVFRARVIGVYFNGLNGEIWETQPVDLFGGISLYREVSIIVQASAPMFFDFLSELPKEDMKVVATIPVNPVASTTGRLPIYGRLPGTVKGQLQKFRLRGNAIARLFEIKVLGRGLGTTETNWSWRDVPLEPTPNEWKQIQMPVRSTPEEFTWVDLPLDSIE